MALRQLDTSVSAEQAEVDSARAWLMVGATVLATFTVFAVFYSFTTVFSTMADEFGSGKGATALMFGLTVFFLFVLSVLTGRLADRWGPRPLVLAGAVAMGAGLVSTSFVDRLWLGYVTYGLGVGVAVACAYVPMVSNVSGWFERHRASALGLAVTGVGLGMLVGPPLASYLVRVHGWRETYRLLAVVAVAGLIVAGLIANRAPAAATTVPGISLAELARRPAFRRLYLSGLLMGLSLFVPFVFLVPYAKDRGISPGTAAALMSILGVGSIGGRVLLGALGGRVGVLRLYQLCFVVMTVSFVVWMGAGSSFAALALFALLLGVSYGGYVALGPAVTAHLFGVVGLGAMLGALYTSTGIGGLAGPPLAGWIIDWTGSYGPAIAAALVLTFASVVLLFTIRPEPPA